MTVAPAACNQAVISFLQEKKKKKPRIYWTSSLKTRAIDGARTRGLDLGKVARYQLRHYRIYVKDAEFASEAGDGNRTHVSSLEGWCSTIELHPQTSQNRNRTSDTRIFSPLLYQLSYLGLCCLMYVLCVCNVDYFNQFYSACQGLFLKKFVCIKV